MGDDDLARTGWEFLNEEEEFTGVRERVMPVPRASQPGTLGLRRFNHNRAGGAASIGVAKVDSGSGQDTEALGADPAIRELDGISVSPGSAGGNEHKETEKRCPEKRLHGGLSSVRPRFLDRGGRFSGVMRGIVFERLRGSRGQERPSQESHGSKKE